MMELLAISEADVDQLHQAGLRILAETGVRFGDKRSRDMLAGAGGKVESETVKMSPEMVEKAIGQCPRRFVLTGRDGREVTVGDGVLHAHTTGGCRDIIDSRTGRPRHTTMADLDDLVRLMDALEGFDITIPLVTVSDTLPESMMIRCYASAVRNSIKPIASPGLQFAAEVRCVDEIARLVGPADGTLTMAPMSPISPLYLPADLCEAMITAAECDIPVMVLPCPISGVSAPITPAGIIAQQHAESLASIVLIETARPGAPVVYCSRATVVNFRTAEAIMGNPEIGMMSACCARIAGRLGLPSDVYGLATSSMVSDIQTGYEKMVNVLVPALAGVDIVSGGGNLHDGVMCSFEQMVIDDEILSVVRRVLAGINVGPDTLALNVVADAIAGEPFLSNEHTVAHLRTGNVWIPGISARGQGEQITKAAAAKATELLAEHTVEPLDEKVQAEIDRILAATEKELAEMAK